MRTITRWLIHHRDTSAHRWLHAIEANLNAKPQRRRLALWDAVLGAWTRDGTRWT